jgi:glycosyltransferase involved in cell wall biosynthesis
VPRAHTEADRLSDAVSVIVPALNASATIARTLAALAAQDFGGGYEVVVVDDGSDDGTARIAEQWDGDVRVVVIRQDRLGPAAARNAGVAAASGRLLAFTDADCYPAPGWLEAGVAALADADLVQGSVSPEPGVERGPWDRTLWVERETGLFETANLFVRRSLFDSLGGFEVWLEPEIGKPLGEDMWFGWRARRTGARSAFCEAALVHHAVFPRGPGGFLAERRRLRYFPAMAAQMPELREQFFFGRLFLARRSAAFDAALAGVAAAAVRRSWLPLAAGAPYARMLLREARPYRRRAPLVAAVRAAADALTLAELARGSVRARTPVL